MRKLLACLVPMILMAGCASRQDEADLSRQLGSFEQRFEQYAIAAGERAWQALEDAEPADENVDDFRALFSNDTLTGLLAPLKGRLQTIENDTLRRRVALWQAMKTAAQVNWHVSVLKLENSIKSEMNVPDEKRSMPADSLEHLALKLIVARNEQARAQGYKHYAEMVLDVTDAGADWYLGLVRTIEAATRPFYEAALDSMTAVKGATPAMMDIQQLFVNYYFSRQGPQLEHEQSMAAMRTLTRDIGFDIDKLPMQFVEKELPGLLVGEGMTLRIPGDFRAVLTPDLGLKNRLHELGHGLQLMHVGITWPVLKGYYWCMGGDNGGWSEAMADVIARFSEAAAWLEQNPETGLPAVNKAGLAAYLRFQLVTMMFEWELYRDPEQDLSALNNSLMQRFLLTPSGDGRAPSLASEIFINYPLYLYSYTVSEIVAWQVHDTLHQRFGKAYMKDARVADFLVERLYRDGELLPWRQRLERATGRGLNVNGYLAAHGLLN